MSTTATSHGDPAAQAESGPHQEVNPGPKKLLNYLSGHRIDAALWLTRLMTIVFALGYVIPVLPFSSPLACYYKAFMANAATSAFRLHQRLPSISFTRYFLATMLLEDSAHYLIFSLIFLFAQPVTIAILPISLFAVLHAASFTLILMNQLSGEAGMPGYKSLVTLVEKQSRNIFRTVAYVEIFLMPAVVFFVFSGRTSIATPFLYFRFLLLRYKSRRNPYSRLIFMELRMSLEAAINSPSVPASIRVLVFKLINFISSFDQAS